MCGDVKWPLEGAMGTTRREFPPNYGRPDVPFFLLEKVSGQGAWHRDNKERFHHMSLTITESAASEPRLAVRGPRHPMEELWGPSIRPVGSCARDPAQLGLQRQFLPRPWLRRPRPLAHRAQETRLDTATRSPALSAPLYDGTASGDPWQRTCRSKRSRARGSLSAEKGQRKGVFQSHSESSANTLLGYLSFYQ